MRLGDQMGYKESGPSDPWEGERGRNPVQANRNYGQEMWKKKRPSSGWEGPGILLEDGKMGSPRSLVSIPWKTGRTSFSLKLKYLLPPETLLCQGPHKGLFSHITVLVHSVPEKGCQFSQFHDTVVPKNSQWSYISCWLRSGYTFSSGRVTTRHRASIHELTPAWHYSLWCWRWGRHIPVKHRHPPTWSRNATTPRRPQSKLQVWILFCRKCLWTFSKVILSFFVRIKYTGQLIIKNNQEFCKINVLMAVTWHCIVW